jgi:hypothetical protein
MLRISHGTPLTAMEEYEEDGAPTEWLGLVHLTKTRLIEVCSWGCQSNPIRDVKFDVPPLINPNASHAVYCSGGFLAVLVWKRNTAGKAR